MQTFYIKNLQSLGYKQHKYAIIGKKCTYGKKCVQHIHKQQSLNINKNPHVNS
jgi:hypothetical protein